MNREIQREVAKLMHELNELRSDAEAGDLSHLEMCQYIGELMGEGKARELADSTLGFIISNLDDASEDGTTGLKEELIPKVVAVAIKLMATAVMVAAKKKLMDNSKLDATIASGITLLAVQNAVSVIVLTSAVAEKGFTNKGGYPHSKGEY